MFAKLRQRFFPKSEISLKSCEMNDANSAIVELGAVHTRANLEILKNVAKWCKMIFAYLVIHLQTMASTQPRTSAETFWCISKAREPWFCIDYARALWESWPSPASFFCCRRANFPGTNDMKFHCSNVEASNFYFPCGNALHFNTIQCINMRWNSRCPLKGFDF